MFGTLARYYYLIRSQPLNRAGILFCPDRNLSLSAAITASMADSQLSVQAETVLKDLLLKLLQIKKIRIRNKQHLYPLTCCPAVAELLSERSPSSPSSLLYGQSPCVPAETNAPSEVKDNIDI